MNSLKADNKQREAYFKEREREGKRGRREEDTQTQKCSKIS